MPAKLAHALRSISSQEIQTVIFQVTIWTKIPSFSSGTRGGSSIISGAIDEAEGYAYLVQTKPYVAIMQVHSETFTSFAGGNLARTSIYT